MEYVLRFKVFAHLVRKQRVISFSDHGPASQHWYFGLWPWAFAYLCSDNSTSSCIVSTPNKYSLKLFNCGRYHLRNNILAIWVLIIHHGVLPDGVPTRNRSNSPDCVTSQLCMSYSISSLIMTYYSPKSPMSPTKIYTSYKLYKCHLSQPSYPHLVPRV